MTDKRIPDGLTTILETWSLVDVYEAHGVLDALDEAEERIARRGDS